MFLVDTDVLIDVWRGHRPAVAWFAACDRAPAVPGFVVMELMQDAADRRAMEQVTRLVAPLEVVWPSRDDCGRALADLPRTGSPMASASSTR